MAELEAEFRKLGQSYEHVIAAAREARRINAIRIHGGEASDGKVTTEAMQKVIEGEVEWEVVEPRSGMRIDPEAEETAEEIEGTPFED